MAQAGFHGLLGLMAGPAIVRRLPLPARARRAALLGFVLGNFLPDADVYAALMAAPLIPDLAPTLHRGLTHSLLGALLPALGFSIAGRLSRDREVVGLGIGLSLGIGSHIALDLIVWFAGLDLFWPLGTLGLMPMVNLWSWVRVPPLLERLLAACEYLAFAAYFTYLGHLAHQTGRGARMARAATYLRGRMLALTALLLVLALALDELPFNVLHYTLWSLVSFPTVLYVTVKMDTTLAATLYQQDDE